MLDPEKEFGSLVRALGGEVINISASSPNHINALDMEAGYSDEGKPVALKSEFVLSLCCLLYTSSMWTMGTAA